MGILCTKLSEAKRTSETLQEYHNLPKAEQGNLKDQGGFVGGVFHNDLRKDENLVSRSLVALDFDYADQKTFAYVASAPFASLLYTTRNHTPEKPRYRVIIPLKRAITKEEYEPIARCLACGIDIDATDPTTFQPSRLMYYPTTSSDGVFFAKAFSSKPWADPDEILSGLHEATNPHFTTLKC